MRKIYVALFMLFIFVSYSQVVSSASSPTLLCLDKGEELEFSKCNSKIDDRTCNDELGCQFCVTEIRNGVYCPRNINDCNYAHLSCTPKKNSIIDDGSSNDNNNQNNNNQNNNDNSNFNSNSNSNSNSHPNSDGGSGIGTSSSLGARITTFGAENLEKDIDKNIKDEKAQEEIIALNSDSKNNSLFFLVGLTLIEILALGGLLFYYNFKELKIERK